MGALWRGTWTTQARILSGLILFVYVLLHFLNLAAVLISPEVADNFQDARIWIVRSIPGTVLVYGALLTHAALALGKIAFSARLQLRTVDLVQVGFGVGIPLLLASHVVFTRGSFQQFGTNDTVSYLAGLIWNTSNGWTQSLLLLMTWIHGCLGLHMWLRVSARWRRAVPGLMAGSTLVPAMALAGFMVEGRRVAAIMGGPDEDARLDFMDDSNFPGPSEFQALIAQADGMFWATAAVLSLTIVIYVVRHIRRPGQRIEIAYADGPVVRSAPGPTVLEISQLNGVPHTALCGGKGRCTTCRIIIEDSEGQLPPPSEAESRALRAVKAPYGSRLACQLRPENSLRVYKVFQSDGQKNRDHASQGKEADLAVLFLDMRGFTARTSGQLPYDVVFLLNRFFDAIVPSIRDAGGTVDKYMGDGLLAVFETDGSESSARAALKAASGIEEALVSFNSQLRDEGAGPIEIGVGLHLGGLVLGDIGARGSSTRTLIGDSVNTASRLEARTKDLKARFLVSEPLLDAAGIGPLPDAMVSLELRGLSEPLRALPVPYSAQIAQVLAGD